MRGCLVTRASALKARPGSLLARTRRLNALARMTKSHPERTSQRSLPTRTGALRHEGLSQGCGQASHGRRIRRWPGLALGGARYRRHVQSSPVLADPVGLHLEAALSRYRRGQFPAPPPSPLGTLATRRSSRSGTPSLFTASAGQRPQPSLSRSLVRPKIIPLSLTPV